MGAVLAFGLIVLTPLQGCKSPAPSQAVSAKTASAKDTAELNRLHKAGEMAYHQSDYPAALQYWERGLALAKEFDSPDHISQFLGNIGVVYGDLGQYERSLT